MIDYLLIFKIKSFFLKYFCIKLKSKIFLSYKKDF